MPTTYPAREGSISGDLVTWSRFLNSPTMVERRLRTLAENRFIADVLLTREEGAEGGSVLYEQNESIFPDRGAEAVEPGAKYPSTTLGEGTALLAAVKKWGVQTEVTDESIRRRRRSPVDKAMAKLTNGVVQKVDTVALAAIASAVTQSIAVATAWTTSTKILRDILTGVATIRALNQGFEPDVLVVSDLTYAIVASDPTIAASIRREDPTAPVYTGRFPVIGGVTILPTPNIPVANTAFLVDTTQLGGLIDEVPLNAKSIRQEDGPSVVEGWVLRAMRATVPIVEEPSAALKFTGI